MDTTLQILICLLIPVGGFIYCYSSKRSLGPYLIWVGVLFVALSSITRGVGVPDPQFILMPAALLLFIYVIWDPFGRLKKARKKMAAKYPKYYPKENAGKPAPRNEITYHINWSHSNDLIGGIDACVGFIAFTQEKILHDFRAQGLCPPTKDASIGVGINIAERKFGISLYYNADSPLALDMELKGYKMGDELRYCEDAGSVYFSMDKELNQETLDYINNTPAHEVERRIKQIVINNYYVNKPAESDIEYRFCVMPNGKLNFEVNLKRIQW